MEKEVPGQSKHNISRETQLYYILMYIFRSQDLIITTVT